MILRYAYFAGSAAGPDLSIGRGGLLLTTDDAPLTIARSCRLSIALTEGRHRAEFIITGQGDPANRVSIGIVNAAFNVATTSVGGDANGIGYRLAEGEIHVAGSSEESVAAGVVGDVVDLLLVFADDGTGHATVAWRLNGVVVAAHAVPAALVGETLYYCVSLGSDSEAGDIEIVVNCGRDDYEFPGGDYLDALFEVPPVGSAVRISDVDYLSAPGDAPANERWNGLLTQSDMAADRAVSFWVWGGSATRGAALSIEITDPDGVTDSLLGGAWRDQPVRIQHTDTDLASATDLGTWLFERLEVIDDLRRRIVCRDALAALEVGLRRRRIRPDAEEHARNRPWPIMLGPGWSVELPLLNEPSRIYALDSRGVDGVGKIRDNGHPFDPYAVPTPDYVITDAGTTVTLSNEAFGIITADATFTGTAYTPPDPIDALGGDGAPFAGSEGAEPTGWDAFRANPLSDLPQLTASMQVRFEQNTTRDSWLIHESAVMLAAQRYRVRVVIDQIAEISETSLYASLLLCSEASPFAAFATLRTPGEHVVIVEPTYTHPVVLYYSANNLVGGPHCLVSAVEVIEIPSVDVDAEDDAVEDALNPIALPEMMRQLIEELGRQPATLWQSTDADTIHASTGYGYGWYNFDPPSTVREALGDILDSCTAGVYPDRTGKLRVMRLFAPESATPVGELGPADILVGSAPVPVRDDAPGLTRTWGCRPNERVMTDTDLSTDLAAVTMRLRRKMGRAFRHLVYYGGPLAPGYEHADANPPHPTRLVDPEDAQLEADFVGGLYADDRGRFFYGPARVAGRSEVDIGDVLTVTYPRWGLHSGTQLLVWRARPLALADEQMLWLWGLGPEL